MQELGYLHEELERWFSSYNKLYVQLVERHLAEAFTSYRTGQEGNFVRRCAPKLANSYHMIPGCWPSFLFINGGAYISIVGGAYLLIGGAYLLVVLID